MYKILYLYYTKQNQRPQVFCETGNEKAAKKRKGIPLSPHLYLARAISTNATKAVKKKGRPPSPLPYQSLYVSSSTQSSMFFCFARATERALAGTSFVMVEPAAVKARSPM